MMVRSFRKLAVVTMACAAFALAAPATPAQTYWFESYERTLDLVEQGRYSEASTLLDSVLKQQPAPIPSLRVPGARFIDYVPYHYRARIDLALGNTSAASHYLEVSEAFGEPTFNRDCRLETIKLRQAIEVKRTIALGIAPLPSTVEISATAALPTATPGGR